MSKVHKLCGDTTECGIKYKWKCTDKRYIHWVFNHNIETDESGAEVDCKNCLKSLENITNERR